MQRRYDDIVIQFICQLVIPFVQLYALYVIFHGHSSPGGGFQGGVILGASFILWGLVFGKEALKEVISPRVMLLLCGTGVLIYAGVGWSALIMGGEYLNYGAIPLLPSPSVRSFMILLVEIGVGTTVTGVMVAIFYLLLGRGKGWS